MLLLSAAATALARREFHALQASQPPTCAPALKVESRDVLFITFGAPENLLDDEAKLPHSTGERKVLQAVAHGAVASGFNISLFNVPNLCDLCESDDPLKPSEAWYRRHLEMRNQGLQAMQYALEQGFHRVVLDNFASSLLCQSTFLHENAWARAKVLLVEFFGGHPEGHCNGTVAPHQILSAWPDEHNTFIGLHGVAKRLDRQRERPAAGLIIGKNPRTVKPDFGVTPINARSDPAQAFPGCVRTESGTCTDNPLLYGGGPEDIVHHPEGSLHAHFQSILPMLKELVRANITLYTTIDEADSLGLPAGVKQLGVLSPSEYLDVLGNVSFALGLGYPLYSPAPLDALANGAAFINPKFPNALGPGYVSFGGKTDALTQHDAIAAMVGSPYTYDVDFRNPQEVIAAANAANKHRFASYVPDVLNEDHINARVCQLLQEALPVGATWGVPRAEQVELLPVSVPTALSRKQQRATTLRKQQERQKPWLHRLSSHHNVSNASEIREQIWEQTKAGSP